MNAARAYRRLKEIEEKKLSNRLMLLRLELDKSQHKIEETKARCRAILEHRSKIEERNRLKEQEMERRRQEYERAQTLNQQIRLRMELQRRANVDKVIVNKSEEARKVMEEHIRNREAITQQRQRELERAIEMRQLVQHHQARSRQVREQQVKENREEAKRAFQERLQEEANRSREYEQRVQMMEEEERRLIAALAEAQEEQRRAYAELEQALLSSKQNQLKVYNEFQSASSPQSPAPRVQQDDSPSRRQSANQIVSAPEDGEDQPPEALVETKEGEESNQTQPSAQKEEAEERVVSTG